MKLFSGTALFELKATHGIPFEVTLQNVIQKGYSVNWVEFIECARNNKWWDFQIIDSITPVLEDVVQDKDTVQHIIQRMKYYMLNNIHPEM